MYDYGMACPCALGAHTNNSTQPVNEDPWLLHLCSYRNLTNCDHWPTNWVNWLLGNGSLLDTGQPGFWEDINWKELYFLHLHLSPWSNQLAVSAFPAFPLPMCSLYLPISQLRHAQNVMFLSNDYTSWQWSMQKWREFQGLFLSSFQSCLDPLAMSKCMPACPHKFK